MKRPIAAFAIALASLLFTAHLSFGRTLHVSPQGDDSASGSSSAPLRTITKAASLARPGDTVLVGPGKYKEAVRIDTAGTAKAPIVFRSKYPGTVTIDGSKGARGSNAVSISASFIEFTGFRVENARRSGISVWRANGVTVADNTITGSHRNGIWIGADRAKRSARNTVEGNVVFSNSVENSRRTWRSGWARGIAIDLSEHTLVRRNIVFNNYGEGIGLLSTERSSVTENVVFDNFSVNIYLDNAPTSRVLRNLVFSSGDDRFHRRGKGAHGIMIANEHTALHLPSRNISVVENTLIAAGDVFYSNYGIGSGLEASRIAPNTIKKSVSVSTLASQIVHRTGRNLNLAPLCGRSVEC